jgi:hypothetical protein
MQDIMLTVKLLLFAILFEACTNTGTKARNNDRPLSLDTAAFLTEHKYSLDLPGYLKFDTSFADTVVITSSDDSITIFYKKGFYDPFDKKFDLTSPSYTFSRAGITDNQFGYQDSLRNGIFSVHFELHDGVIYGKHSFDSIHLKTLDDDTRDSMTTTNEFWVAADFKKNMINEGAVKITLKAGLTALFQWKRPPALNKRKVIKWSETNALCDVNRVTGNLP